MKLRVRDVERLWVNVPFRPIPARHMIRELPHWTVFELCKATLDNGVVGVGETMVYYTWGATTDEAVRRTIGRSALELMWDDSLGAGLQSALFDAVGRSLDAPVHRLLGEKVKDKAPISWWSIDMPAEDWAAECQEALQNGYVSCKFKARPWFDLQEQLRLATAALPDHFEIDLDFNAMLLDSAHALRVIKELQGHSRVKILESPIPQSDSAGGRFLRSRSGIPIAMHAESPPLAVSLAQDLCDGYVVSGGVSRVLREAHAIAEANKVLWLQLVGTGLTTAFSLHLAAVLTHARWPAISCVNMYETTLLRQPLRVDGGYVAIPDEPGLGFDVDWDAVERFRIDPIPKPYPHPNLLIRVRWPSGEPDFYAHGLQYWYDFMMGRRPIFTSGVHMDVAPDDGGGEWRRLYEQARTKPAWTMRPN